MKKFVVCAVAGLALIAGLVIGGYAETHYTRKDCFVVRVDQGIVTVEDNYGHWWEYETETNSEKKGDRVSLEMYTNHTENIFDDVIEKVIKNS